MDAWCDRVSDVGIPVSEEGAELLQTLDNEVEKRNQDRLGMHIYEDWNGWGMSEAFSNYVGIVMLLFCTKRLTPGR